MNKKEFQKCIRARIALIEDPKEVEARSNWKRQMYDFQKKIEKFDAGAARMEREMQEAFEKLEAAQNAVAQYYRRKIEEE